MSAWGIKIKSNKKIECSFLRKRRNIRNQMMSKRDPELRNAFVI